MMKYNLALVLTSFIVSNIAVAQTYECPAGSTITCTEDGTGWTCTSGDWSGAYADQGHKNPSNDKTFSEPRAMDTGRALYCEYKVNGIKNFSSMVFANKNVNVKKCSVIYDTPSFICL